MFESRSLELLIDMKAVNFEALASMEFWTRTSGSCVHHLGPFLMNLARAGLCISSRRLWMTISGFHLLSESFHPKPLRVNHIPLALFP